MPRPPESPDVKASKALAYILRHGAEKEGISIRSDGYVKLHDVLARPKMKDIDLTTVIRLVEENAKKRFELIWAYDPSPPKKKKKPVQGMSKKEKAALRAKAIAQAEAEAEAAAGAVAVVGINDTPLLPALKKDINDKRVEVDAASLDTLQHDISKASLNEPSTIETNSRPSPLKPPRAVEVEESTELPLVILPLPSTDSENNEDLSPDPFASTSRMGESSSPSSTSKMKGEYYIRASQGHSIALESTSHLTLINNDEEGRQKAGQMIHGTKWELWDVIKTNGLSRMTRQHIHLAPSFSGSITPRNNSTLFIHLDLASLIQAGIPVYVSANGVILTPGDEDGVVKKEYWRLAWRKERGRRFVVWENGQQVERELGREEWFDTEAEKGEKHVAQAEAVE